VEQKRRTWKERLGIGLFIYSFVPICTVELVALLPVPASQAMAFGAGYLLSGELACFTAVALLGKPFVVAMKEKIMGFFRRKAPAAPATPKVISRARHYIGVTMLLLSFLPYIITELALFFSHPTDADLRWLMRLLLSGEVLFFVSLFVLGDEFWARLKHLFEWPGKEQQAG